MLSLSQLTPTTTSPPVKSVKTFSVTHLQSQQMEAWIPTLLIFDIKDNGGFNCCGLLDRDKSVWSRVSCTGPRELQFIL